MRRFCLGLICLLLLCSCTLLAPPFSLNKTLTIATDPVFPPFEFESSDGKVQGFDLDLIQAIAREANFQFKIANLPFEGLIPALQAGKIDLAISNIAITSERQKTVDFSQPYFPSRLAMAVASNNNSITNIDDLKNQKVAVALGTVGAVFAKQIPGAIITTFDSFYLTIQALLNGNVAATIHDDPVLRYAIKRANIQEIKVIDKPLNKGYYYGIATPKNSIYLAKINQALNEIIENGIYTELYHKWFDGEPPKLPIDAIAKSSNLTPEISPLQIILPALPLLFQGVLVTLFLTISSIIIGTISGSLIGILRLSPYGFLSFIARSYIDFFRGTPLLVQIFMIYFGLPALAQSFDLPITLARLPSAIMALSLNCAAYIAEIVRGGIQSIDRGQTEAAKSLGLNPVQTVYHIIFPQAFRRMLPPLGNQFITVLKDTSLVAVIGFEELFRHGQLIVADNYRSFEIYTTVALIYLCLTIVASQVFSFWEKLMNPIKKLDQ